MATQALTMPNSTTAPSMPASGKGALEDCGSLAYFEPKTKPSLKSTEDSVTALKDSAQTTKPRLVLKDQVKRGHVYVNLPTQLPLSPPTRPSQFVTNHSTSKTVLHTSNGNQIVMKPDHQMFEQSSAGESNKNQIISKSVESNEEKSDKFCWSPRCPPDGAAVYDTSPTNSSISSSPIIKSHSALTAMRDGLPECEPQKQDASLSLKKDSQSSNLDPNLVSAKLTSCGKPLNISLPPLASTLTGVSQPDLGLSPKKVPKPKETKPQSKFQDNSTRNFPGGETRQHTTLASSPPLPLPPPPIQSPVPSQTNDANLPYYHQHARADELCLDPARKTTPSGNTSSQSKQQNRSTSLSTSLPFPLPPPAAPAVPRRDPNTVLQNNAKQSASPVDGATEQSNISTPIQNSPSGSVEPASSRTTLTPKSSSISLCPSSASSPEMQSTVCRPTGTGETTQHHTNQQPKPVQSDALSQPTTPSSSAKPIGKHVISRPIPVKSSPETETVPLSPIGYERHSSLPNQPIVIDVRDGRTVVPWNPNSKDPSLKASLSESKDTLQDAVTAALLSQSTTLPDATPQWIPPEQTTMRQRSINVAPNKKVEFIGSESVEVAHSQTVSSSSSQDIQAKRPSCITTSAQQTMCDRTRPRPQRSQTGYVSSRSERGARRHHTTSDVEPIRLATEQHFSGVIGYPAHSATRGPVRPSTLDVNGGALDQNECHSLSPTEAEWWRAQQRSKMIALAESHNVARSGKMTADNLFHRQVSAGPSFTVSPTDPRQFPPSEMFISETDSLPAELPRTRYISTNSHGMAQPLHRRQFLEDSLLLQRAQSDGLGYKVKIPHQMEPSMQYVRDFRHIPAEVELQRSRSIPNKYRDHMEQQAYNPVEFDFRSDMTQSVLAPPISGWEASVPVTMESRQASSSSGRRRRSKNGILRSQSHRTAEQKSKQMLSEASSDEFHSEAIPASHYQHYVSQTVPAEAISGAWPPVLVQWHNRRPIVYAPDVFDAQSDHQWQPRKNSRVTSGRSTQDLMRIDGKKRFIPHHHSASAIFDRLDMQPWFHFDLSRAAAERILKTKHVGSFLVRQSETCKSEYSLSIRRESDVLHMKISNDPDTGYYVLGEYSQPYPSVSAMIYRYTRSLLPVRGSTPILLQFPVERATIQHQSQPKS